jgi:hypothetical protein
MRYVEYDVWTGRIYKVSSMPSLPTKSTMDVIEVDDPIIQEISDDKRSLESAFIGTDLKAYNKKGTIHLIKQEKEFTELSTEKIGRPDVTINLYTNNKLMEITIIYSALKTWYNHRMKKDFKFADDYKFEFELKNKYATKLIEFSSKKLLETFNTTIDLSSFKDLTDIKVSTKRLFKNYHLNIKKNKYINYDDDDVIFNKVSTNINDKKKWNIIISKTTTKNVIEFEIVKLNTSIIYKTLDFYITGKDPNELHEILSIPIERLWENKWIQFELKDDLNNKNIWCNVNSLNILLDDKIIKL